MAALVQYGTLSLTTNSSLTLPKTLDTPDFLNLTMSSLCLLMMVLGRILSTFSSLLLILSWLIEKNYFIVTLAFRIVESESFSPDTKHIMTLLMEDKCLPSYSLLKYSCMRLGTR